ncbi:serpentine type 7TM GPCR chemoreceptor str domain-containing protein [Ditylenchus destructor]|uniref:Serpentine type 7TM GPCR chemoreceptor str domain-containing protein n=1 Tax=Ditylenchus destructor TaxID=166010 RepID=A0AAD4MQ04_9BILA|nr:serpentine type 7TM GPCR chemoreceptor str domain-containing protein [Ditylenchus destructor]
MADNSSVTEQATYTTFSSIYSGIAYGCFVLGAVLNALLIWLIIKKTSGEMRHFKSILLQTSLLDVCMLVASVLVQPIFIMLQGSVILLQNGPLRALPMPLNFIVAEAWTFGYYFSIIANVVQFIHRYLVVCHNAKMTPQHHFSMLFVGAIVVLVHNYLIYYAMYPGYKMKVSIVDAVEGYFSDPKHRDDNSTSIVITMAGYPAGWHCVIHCIYHSILEVLIYVIILFCALRIKNFVKKAAYTGMERGTAATAPLQQQSRHVRDVNRQLTYTLMMQAVLPLGAVFIGAVCTYMCLSAYFDGSLMSFYFIAYTTVPVLWIPVLNPLITLLVVKQYRRFLFKYVGLKSKTGVTTTMVVSMVTVSRNNSLHHPSISQQQQTPRMSTNTV